MARFDRQIALAQRLISKNGEQSTLRRPSTTVPDPSIPWERDAGSPVDQTVSALWLDFESTRIDGVLVKLGDQRVLIPAGDVTGAAPDASLDKLVREGQTEEWEIVRVKTLNPNGQFILYECQVRR